MKTYVICVLLVLLAGCKGTPTQGEKEARRQVQAVAGAYRPEGRKPELPVLTSQSGLSNYLAYALLNQPQVEAAYYDWLASVERITVERSLPDPQLTFQMDIQQVVTSIMPGLMMSFPGLGKLRAAGAVAAAESQGKYYAFQTAALQSAYAVERAYYQLYFLEEEVRVNRETLALLTDLAKLARAQNEVGKVTLQDVLRAQIEQDRVETDIADLEDSRAALLAQFKAALGLRADEPAPPIPQHFESTPLDLTADEAFEAALAHNTRLKGMEAEVRAADAAIAQAYKARMPDASLGLMADVKINPTLYRPWGTVRSPFGGTSWRRKLPRPRPTNVRARLVFRRSSSRWRSPSPKKPSCIAKRPATSHCCKTSCSPSNGNRWKWPVPAIWPDRLIFSTLPMPNRPCCALASTKSRPAPNASFPSPNSRSSSRGCRRAGRRWERPRRRAWRRPGGMGASGAGMLPSGSAAPRKTKGGM